MDFFGSLMRAIPGGRATGSFVDVSLNQVNTFNVHIIHSRKPRHGIFGQNTQALYKPGLQVCTSFQVCKAQ